MLQRPLLLFWAVLSTAVGTGSAAMAEPTRAADAPKRIMTLEFESLVDAALEDAARRTALDRARLKVISAEAVTWSDGSLGCPKPGVLYTQALVPGYRIRIGAGAEVLDYHAGRRGPPVLCPPDRALEPVPGGPT